MSEKGKSLSISLLQAADSRVIYHLLLSPLAPCFTMSKLTKILWFLCPLCCIWQKTPRFYTTFLYISSHYRTTFFAFFSGCHTTFLSFSLNAILPRFISAHKKSQLPDSNQLQNPFINTSFVKSTRLQNCTIRANVHFYPLSLNFSHYFLPAAG